MLELEQQGYIVREQGRDAKGKLTAIVYTVYEQPQTLESPRLENPNTDDPMPPRLGFPNTDNPVSDKPYSDNPTQINIDNNIKQTDVSSIHPSIRAAGGDSMDAMDAMTAYRQILTENIAYGILCQQHEAKVDEINEILELMLETVCSTKKTIRVNSEAKPAELVKAQMLRLDDRHINYVLECMDENTTDVRNIRDYLLTALYNAPGSICSHYKSRVNHDFHGSS